MITPPGCTIVFMNNNQIDYIEFPAKDLIKIKQFYSDTFGWVFTDYGPDYTSFNDGRLSGGFTTEVKLEGKSPLIVIYSEELEKTQKSVVDNGGMIVREIFEFPGGRRFHFTDPSGNTLAVWSDR